MKRDVQLLLAEADRFIELAKDAALMSVDNNTEPGPYSQETFQARAKCREHLLRAETFRAAAALIGGSR